MQLTPRFIEKTSHLLYRSSFGLSLPLIDLRSRVPHFFLLTCILLYIRPLAEIHPAAGSSASTSSAVHLSLASHPTDIGMQ
jgi:hypothetical protein